MSLSSKSPIDNQKNRSIKHKKELLSSWYACSFAVNSNLSDKEVKKEFDKWYKREFKK